MTRDHVLAAVAAIALSGGVGCAPSRTPPDVAMISWDSTRADRVSAYGYSRPTTPRLDELAADSVLFEWAFTQHNWTRPSYYATLSGMHNWELPRNPETRVPLAPQLQELLQRGGYRTVGLVQNPHLAERFGFGRGWDRFGRRGALRRPATMAQTAVDVLRAESEGSQPLFFFFHSQGPHYPLPMEGPWVELFLGSNPDNLKPEDFTRVLNHSADLPEHANRAAAVRTLNDLYDAAIRESDDALSEVLTALEASPRRSTRELLLIFFSDHGDALGDRDSFGHGRGNLYPELTRVPLVVRFPPSLRAAPQRIEATVRLIDLFPTVLEVAGLPAPPEISGRSLLPLDRLAATPRLAISNMGQWAAFRRGRWAVHLAESGDVISIHDRTLDPAERRPLSGEILDPELQRLVKLARAWHGAFPEDGEPEMDPGDLADDLRESLRALGYLD